ncbi:hypothetical protein BH18THE2_BH18THE2_39770 [soil metagenome]
MGLVSHVPFVLDRPLCGQTTLVLRTATAVTMPIRLMLGSHKRLKKVNKRYTNSRCHLIGLHSEDGSLSILYSIYRKSSDTLAAMISTKTSWVMSKSLATQICRYYTLPIGSTPPQMC